MGLVDYLYPALTKTSTALLLTLWCIRVVGYLRNQKEKQDGS